MGFGISLFAKLYRGSISFSSARASWQRASSGLLQGTIAKFYKMPEGVLAHLREVWAPTPLTSPF